MHEIEQKADAYRYRAWKELGKAWSKETDADERQRLVVLGQRDLEAAKALYEQIPNFNQADGHLRQVKSVYKKTLPEPPVQIKVGQALSPARKAAGRRKRLLHQSQTKNSRARR